MNENLFLHFFFHQLLLECQVKVVYVISIEITIFFLYLEQSAFLPVLINTIHFSQNAIIQKSFGNKSNVIWLVAEIDRIVDGLYTIAHTLLTVPQSCYIHYFAFLGVWYNAKTYPSKFKIISVKEIAIFLSYSQIPFCNIVEFPLLLWIGRTCFLVCSVHVSPPDWKYLWI